MCSSIVRSWYEGIALSEGRTSEGTGGPIASDVSRPRGHGSHAETRVQAFELECVTKAGAEESSIATRMEKEDQCKSKCGRC